MQSFCPLYSRGEFLPKSDLQERKRKMERKTNLFETMGNHVSYCKRFAELKQRRENPPPEEYSIMSLLHHCLIRNEADELRNYRGFSEWERLFLEMVYAEEAYFFHDIYMVLEKCGYSEEELDVSILL